MTERYLDQAIKYLAGATKPLKIRELARKLGIKQAEYREFRRIIKDAVSEGKLSRGKGGKLALPSKEDFLSGKLFVSRAGYGFVITKQETGDIFISRTDMGGAIHGEQVEVILKSSTRGKGLEGKIVKVLEREKGRVVGKVTISRYGLNLRPADPRIAEKIELSNPRNLPVKKNDCQRQALSLGGSVSSAPRAYRGVAGHGGSARYRYRFPDYLSRFNSGI
jgi:exoribonuclease R